MSPPTSRSTHAGALIAIALAAAVPSAGCESAVKHPAITAGIVGGTMGFTTCKLGSDNTGACLAVTGGVAVFLGLVAATALWLGGDGHPPVIEDEPVQPLQPLPADEPPRRRRHHPPDEPPAEPAPAATSPAPATPGSASPAPASPTPAIPAPPTPASETAVPPPPASTAPAPAAPTPAAPPAATPPTTPAVGPAPPAPPTPPTTSAPPR